MMLNTICEIARRAGVEAMRFYGTGDPVAYKADASPLTKADQASHELIVQALEGLPEGYPVISEEAREALPNDFDRVKTFWLVDPLDGTKEFLKQTGEFTVNIALIEDQRPILGVVHAPARGLTYFGGRNQGAWKQEGDQSPMAISTRPAHVKHLCVVASRDHAGRQVKAMLERIPDAQCTSMGSSLKFCLVAEGRADLYLRDVPTMEWDTAAAQCIVEIAGGRILDLKGEPLRYQKPTLKNDAIITMGDPGLDWKALIG